MAGGAGGRGGRRRGRCGRVLRAGLGRLADRDVEVDPRRAGPLPDRLDPAAVDPLADQEVAHGVGALLRLRLRDARRVDLDPQLEDLRVPLHHQRDVVHHLRGGVAQRDLAAVADEAELLVDLNLPLAEADPFGAGIGAAVVVLDAVEGLGLHRALVDGVGDAVLVVVGIGAAVLVLEPVGVLGRVRAVVEVVGDAVAVVVGIGAAVGVLEAVLVLGLVGALVDAVGDAVAVAVLGGRRAAVVRELPLVVFGRRSGRRR